MHEVEDLGAFIALNVSFIIVMIGQLWGGIGIPCSRRWF